MIVELVDCGTDGLGNNPLEIESTDVVSVSVDPARPDEPKSVVTMNNGTWFLVQGSVDEVKAKIFGS